MQPVKCMFEEDILGQFQKLIDASYTSTNKYLLEVWYLSLRILDSLRLVTLLFIQSLSHSLTQSFTHSLPSYPSPFRSSINGTS